ncbi:hypothetical protein EVAR_11601_1 [Eumeta japonica]|uniref:Uncharacterized protein n=1 Tax=Eumeta variegata TaxID=151549 RepID=A0A4C1X3N5_EUMVA|nr:hypothetical protein EVAR_11601_1 [Eumeta japonica]
MDRWEFGINLVITLCLRNPKKSITLFFSYAPSRVPGCIKGCRHFSRSPRFRARASGGRRASKVNLHDKRLETTSFRAISPPAARRHCAATNIQLIVVLNNNAKVYRSTSARATAGGWRRTSALTLSHLLYLLFLYWVRRKSTKLPKCSNVCQTKITYR